MVVTQVLSLCTTISGLGAYVALSAHDQAQNDTGLQLMNKEFAIDFTPAHASVEFFVGPGEELGLKVFNANAQDGLCAVTLGGYFVNLP